MKNNKRKVLPLLLAGVLLLSAGAYGTRAYFTDSADQNMEIELTLGNLKIANVVDAGWVYMPIEAGEYTINEQLKEVLVAGPKLITGLERGEVLGKDITLMDVRPGDAFERVISFKNSGTLDQKVTLITDAAVIDEKVLDIYDISIKVEETTIKPEYVIVKSGEDVKYTINIAVNAENGLNGEIANLNTTALKYLEKALKVVAVQPNAPVPVN